MQLNEAHFICSQLKEYLQSVTNHFPASSSAFRHSLFLDPVWFFIVLWTFFDESFVIILGTSLDSFWFSFTFWILLDSFNKFWDFFLGATLFKSLTATTDSLGIVLSSTGSFSSLPLKRKYIRTIIWNNINFDNKTLITYFGIPFRQFSYSLDTWAKRTSSAPGSIVNAVNGSSSNVTTPRHSQPENFFNIINDLCL